MRSKALCAVVLLVALTLLLAACGGDDDDSGTTTSVAPAPGFAPPSGGAAPSVGALPPALLQCFADKGYELQSPTEIHSAPPEVVNECFGALHQGG